MKPQSVLCTKQHFLPAYPDTHIWVFSRGKCLVSIWTYSQFVGINIQEPFFLEFQKQKAQVFEDQPIIILQGIHCLHPSHSCVGKIRQGRCYQNTCGNRWCLTERDLWHSSSTPWHELSGTLDKDKSLKLWYFCSDKLGKMCTFQRNSQGSWRGGSITIRNTRLYLILWKVQKDLEI